MNPVAFELFGYPIRWYGIIIAGGVLVAFFISYILAKKKGLDFDIITDGFLWSFPFAIIGARLYYVAFEYKNYHSFIDVPLFRRRKSHLSAADLFGHRRDD